MDTTTGSARDALRRMLRARRRKLTGADREAAQARLIQALRGLPIYRRARHVAVYFAVDGEIDLSACFADALRRGVALYAPRLLEDRLVFHSLEAGSVLTANQFGIPEPSGGAAIDPRSLDLVLTPLVGFDRFGTRLGMGKGYYDRTFRFLGNRKRWLKPKLIGIGFDFQEVSTIATAPWDIGLWGVVTNSGAQRCRPESAQ